MIQRRAGKASGDVGVKNRDWGAAGTEFSQESGIAHGGRSSAVFIYSYQWWASWARGFRRLVLTPALIVCR